VTPSRNYNTVGKENSLPEYSLDFGQFQNDLISWFQNYDPNTAGAILWRDAKTSKGICEAAPTFARLCRRTRIQDSATTSYAI
jgi:hypothetical protein